METSPDPWIGALRHSQDRLQALVASPMAIGVVGVAGGGPSCGLPAATI
jgi:hypothetical protein